MADKAVETAPNDPKKPDEAVDMADDGVETAPNVELKIPDKAVDIEDEAVQAAPKVKSKKPDEAVDTKDEAVQAAPKVKPKKPDNAGQASKVNSKKPDKAVQTASKVKSEMPAVTTEPAAKVVPGLTQVSGFNPMQMADAALLYQYLQVVNHIVPLDIRDIALKSGIDDESVRREINRMRERAPFLQIRGTTSSKMFASSGVNNPQNNIFIKDPKPEIIEFDATPSARRKRISEPTSQDADVDTAVSQPQKQRKSNAGAGIKKEDSGVGPTGDPNPAILETKKKRKPKAGTLFKKEDSDVGDNARETVEHQVEEPARNAEDLNPSDTVVAGQTGQEGEKPAEGMSTAEAIKASMIDWTSYGK